MNNRIKKITMIAMLTALAYVAMLLIKIPVVLFLNYEPKDTVIVIGGFIFGPVPSFIISFVVSLIEMITVSSTGYIGAIMNLISTCAFACTAAYIYKKKHDMKGAVIGLIAGTLTMVGVMLLWNYLITPLYMKTSRADVAAMLIPVFLPFNLIKGTVNTALTLLIYKPLVTSLRNMGLLETREESGEVKAKMKVNVGVLLFAIGLLITAVIVWLVIKGVI